MRFLNSLANQARVAKGWMFAAFLFAGTTVYLTYMVVHLASNTPVKLIPYNFSTSKGIAEVRADGTDSQEYIALIATADVKLLTDWRFDTIETQYRRLLNRMTSTLHGQQVSHLLSEADRLSKSNQSQWLLIDSNPRARNGNEVIMKGRLQRYEGSELVVDQTVEYQLTYEYVHGVPYLHSLELLEDQRGSK